MFDPPISHPLFYVCLSVISYFLHNVSYFARHRVNVVEPRRESELLMTHRRASGWVLNQDSLRTAYLSFSQVREPMPAVFFFLIDVSMNALQTGATAGACSAISQVIADLPVSSC